jgi:phosphatidylglycerophosphate synthase
MKKSEFVSELLNPANILSLARVPLGALILLFFNDKTIVISLLLIAGISDALDGFIARKLGPTKIGAILDGTCDKIFTLTILIFLSINIINPLEFTVFLMRDIYVIFLAIILFFDPRKKYLGAQIKARWPGKLTTVVQYVLIASIVVFGNDHYLFYFIGIISSIAIIDYSVYTQNLLKQNY